MTTKKEKQTRNDRQIPEEFRANVTPRALTAATEIAGKISRAGRPLDDKQKGAMLLAACEKHGCTVTDIAWALDFLAWEVRRVNQR